MTKKAKRLSISMGVLRRLFVYSGNQCAYPGCNNKIVNEDGTYVSQICHIEAAKEGGERYNPNMTDEERADFPNLLLLCYEHHRVTNNVKEYPVKKLQKMKKQHESKFKNLLKDMNKSMIADITKKQEIILPKSLDSMNEILKWYHNENELQSAVDLMCSAIRVLTKITPETRAVFLVMLDRSEKGEFVYNDVRTALEFSQDEMDMYLGLLIEKGLVTEPENVGDHREWISKFGEVDGWNMWENIKFYCETSNVNLYEVIYNLRFDLLD